VSTFPGEAQSRCFLDHRITSSRWFLGALGTPGTGFVEFRWVRRSTDLCTQSRKSSANPHRAQSRRTPALFQGQSHVFDESAGQSELCVGRHDEPRPALGLLGCSQCGRGPTERVLDEPVGVLDVEASQIGAPAEIEVRLSRSRPPQQSVFFTPVPSREGYRVVWAHSTVRAARRQRSSVQGRGRVGGSRRARCAPGEPQVTPSHQGRRRRGRRGCPRCAGGHALGGLHGA
jgi:hypothetical protein